MPGSSHDPHTLLPLTEVFYEVLVSLGDTARHGYGILKEIEERTAGRLVLRPGTLYRAIDRLLDLELIEESGIRPDPDQDDERRRYYQLTDFGRAVVGAEAQRLQNAVQSARAKQLMPERAK